MAELDKDKIISNQIPIGGRLLSSDKKTISDKLPENLSSNQLFCGAYASNYNLMLQESVVQIGG